jgi:hypothetical protein
MLNLVKVFSLFLVFFANIASANLIQSRSSDIPVGSYVTYGGYDWVWASPVNNQFYMCDPKNDDSSIDYDNFLTEVYTGSDCQASTSSFIIPNQLLAPSYYSNAGWDFFENLFTNQSLTEYFSSNNIIIDEFFLNTDTQDNIEAFSYWNTAINGTFAFGNPFASDWTGNARSISPFSFEQANTVYVRKSQPVPEPSTLLIFALGLIALAARLKVAKK